MVALEDLVVVVLVFGVLVKVLLVIVVVIGVISSSRVHCGSSTPLLAVVVSIGKVACK